MHIPGCVLSELVGCPYKTSDTLILDGRHEIATLVEKIFSAGEYGQRIVDRITCLEAQIADRPQIVGIAERTVVIVIVAVGAELISRA